MVKINNILLPIDFSTSSDEAVEYALQLARINNANIHLLTVIEPLVIRDIVPADYANIIKSYEESVQTKMDALVATLLQESPKIKVFPELLKQFEPTDAILSKVKKENIDLVVMGSHGRRGLDRVLLGSVTEAVMREADCPVLVLRIKGKK